MDLHFDLNGTRFVWNDEKARRNVLKHDGITFEQAAEVFFDPLFRLIDAAAMMKRAMQLSATTRWVGCCMLFI
ncbi:MAG: BrnT family toxin [Methylobacillus sp.]|jgi:uncharacterized DUF497 family protein|nr:BrnT family toxin [Methylobacillus sp.]